MERPQTSAYSAISLSAFSNFEVLQQIQQYHYSSKNGTVPRTNKEPMRSKHHVCQTMPVCRKVRPQVLADFSN